MIALFAGGWVAVAVVAGLLIGKGIRHADEIEGRTQAVQDATDRASQPLYVPQEWTA